MSNESQNNPFSLWIDANKNLYELWSNSVSQIVPQANAGTASNPFAAYYESITKSLGQIPGFSFGTVPNVNSIPGVIDAVGSATNQVYQQWQEGIRNLVGLIPNQSVKDGFNRFMNSYQLYNGLQSYWEKFVKAMPTDIKNWDDFVKPIIAQYQTISQDFLAPFQPFFVPDQLKSFYNTPLENAAIAQKLFVDLFKPLLDDSSSLQSLLVKALQGDKEAYVEFLKASAEVYKKSYAKLLNVPVMGSNRESIEKLLRLLDYYVNFAISYNEYSVIINNSLTKTMENLLSHIATLQSEGNSPQTFMEFYKIWSEFNEKAFQELFVTEEFEKIMNETISTGSKFKVLFDDFLQDMVESLPFPNRREMDSVEEEVYKLRKKVKTQEKELKALKDQVAAPAPAAPAKETKSK